MHSGRPRNQIVNDQSHCAACGHWKPVSDFYARRDSATRLDSYCKPCRRAANALQGRRRVRRFPRPIIEIFHQNA